MDSEIGSILHRMVDVKVDLCDHSRFVEAAAIQAGINLIRRLAAPSPEAVLDKLADDVLEARRYCKSDPDHVRGRIVDLNRRIESDALEWVDFRRLTVNLDVGAESVGVNYELAEGYLYGAAAELRAAADRARKAADAPRE